MTIKLLLVSFVLVFILAACGSGYAGDVERITQQAQTDQIVEAIHEAGGCNDE